jgi:hypothetical protein
MTPEQNEVNFKQLTASVTAWVKNTELRDKLLAFLNKNAAMLKSTPASSKHHHAEIGGLLRHMVEVTMLSHAAMQTMQQFSGFPADRCAQQDEDLVVAVVLHDLHKMCDPFGRQFYEPNVLKSGKVSDAIPYKRNPTCFMMRNHLTMAGKSPTDALPAAVGEFVDRNRDDIQEGELSLLLLHVMDPVLYALLNDEVKYCVRYHDGAYSASGFELAGKETPTMLALHHADMVSSRADRWRNPKAD